VEGEFENGKTIEEREGHGLAKMIDSTSLIGMQLV
jgi:hypothetical protein